MMLPSLEVLGSEERLLGVREEWLGLLDRAATNEPTLSPQWLLAWWRCFGALGGRRLAVGAFRDGGRLVGLAPLLRRTHRHGGVVPLRRLEALASGEPQADEVHSEYLGIIAERGLEAMVASALAAGVVTGRFGAADELVVPAMNGDEPMADLLVAAFRQAGWHAAVSPMPGAPYTALPRSWDEYLLRLSGRNRKHLRRAEHDLEAWAEGTLRLRAVEHPSELAEGFAVLERLHSERWHSERAHGAFASPLFRSFHQAVMPALLEAKALELLWLEAKGEPIAAVYNIVWGNKVHHYQAGRRLYAHGWAFRPGAVIQAHAIRRAIAMGRREYDFLGGPARYKLDFAPTIRPLVHFRAARVGLREGVLQALKGGRAFVRRLRSSWWAHRQARIASR